MLWAVVLVLIFLLAAWLVGHIVDKLFQCIETTLENKKAVKKEFDVPPTTAEVEQAHRANQVNQGNQANQANHSLRSISSTSVTPSEHE